MSLQKIKSVIPSDRDLTKKHCHGVRLAIIGLRKARNMIVKSRMYEKLFVVDIDHERVEEMKEEMMHRYRRKGFF